MTTKRIDELTAATSLTGDDLIPIMDGATTTKKITAATDELSVSGTIQIVTGK